MSKANMEEEITCPLCGGKIKTEEIYVTEYGGSDIEQNDIDKEFYSYCLKCNIRSFGVDTEEEAKDFFVRALEKIKENL